MQGDKKNHIYQGHVLNILKTFPDESIDCVITSPPYFGLRDYGLEPIIWDGKDCEHEWNDINGKKLRGWSHTDDSKEVFGQTHLSGSNFCLKCSAWKGSLGLEPTPELYLKHLLEIFDEIKRTLKPTGTVWVNIGDSYSSRGGAVREEFKKILGSSQSMFDANKYDISRTSKRFLNIPAKSLVGIPEMFALGMRDRGWIRRNTIIWHKPNCMPSSSRDRFTVDFEFVYFFTKTGKYWFEQQFEEYEKPLNRWGGDYLKANGIGSWAKGTGQNIYRYMNMRPNKQGRNKRCVWIIPTQPFPEAHFSTFPEALVEPMIKAGCPPDGIVLDPFCGSGTTLRVAEKLNRFWLGIDLNPKYIDMAKNKRLKGIQKILL